MQKPFLPDATSSMSTTSSTDADVSSSRPGDLLFSRPLQKKKNYLFCKLCLCRFSPQGTKKKLLPFQSIPVRSKPTSSIPSHSSEAKNELPLFQAFPVMPKPTSSIPSHLSQVKPDFLHSKAFQSDQNRLPLIQAILVRPKPTSSIAS
jgi:hypothetical protein